MFAFYVQNTYLHILGRLKKHLFTHRDMPPEQENYPQVPLNQLDMEGCLGHMYNNYLRWSGVVKVTLIINTQRVFQAFLQTKFKLQYGAVL